MVSKLEQIASWLALPIYVWQGLATRRRTMRMQPPEMQEFVDIKGKGKPIRLLAIGDSSIAGLGVKDFKESVAGSLPYKLKQLTNRAIHCRSNGNSSATAGNIRDFALPNIEHAQYDYIVLSIGVNDAKNFHSGKRFCKEFGTLIYALHARFPEATIIWSGIVDLGGIPTLPSPLNKILSIRSRILDKNGRILCFERGALSPQSHWKPVRENFSEDGFHCSAIGYGKWADELAQFIAGEEQRKSA